jgi:hypothetical protein
VRGGGEQLLQMSSRGVPVALPRLARVRDLRGTDPSLGFPKLSDHRAWRESLPAGLEGWTLTFYDFTASVTAPDVECLSGFAPEHPQPVGRDAAGSAGRGPVQTGSRGEHNPAHRRGHDGSLAGLEPAHGRGDRPRHRGGPRRTGPARRRHPSQPARLRRADLPATAPSVRSRRDPAASRPTRTSPLQPARTSADQLEPARQNAATAATPSTREPAAGHTATAAFPSTTAHPWAPSAASSRAARGANAP